MRRRAGSAGAFQNSAARQNYYDGEYLLLKATNKLEIREAQRLLEEAIRIEPTCSVGYATAALAYGVGALSEDGEMRDKYAALAVDRAQQAIRLNDVTGYPHLVMAQVHLTNREYDEASAAAERGVSDRPSCPAAYTIKASVLNFLGRSSEAIEYAQYALRLTPVHPPIYSGHPRQRLLRQRTP